MRARSGPAGSSVAALATAVLLDAVLGEPPEAVHPVVWMGRLIRSGIRPDPPAAGIRALLGGAVVTGAGAGASAGLAVPLAQAARRLPTGIATTAEATLLLPLLALRGLTDAAARVAAALEAGDLAAARGQLPWLVGRPLDGLSAELLGSAAVESLAENLADSVVAPLLLARLGGPGLAAAHRFVNTADAMVGHPERFARGGRAAARADDLLAYVPARVAAAAVAVACPLAGGSTTRALAVWRADGTRTPSPNSGRPMAAMAGGLGVRLEKRGAHVLNADGHGPGAADVRRAVRVVRGATALVLAGCALLPRPGRSGSGGGRGRARPRAAGHGDA